MKRASIVLGCALLIGNAGSNAQQHPSCAGARQLGTWALQSYVTEDLETGQKTPQFGEHPSGYLSYGPDCRMYAILIKENRKAPAALVPTDAERVDLYGGLVAYAGAYTIDADKVSHHIDASWNQAWTGTTQVRQFRIDGNTLHIRTLPAKSAITGRQSVSELVWTKVQ
jgi:hypothetical protein